MNGFIDSFAYWLADFYLLSTILLIAALAAMWFTKQPVKRLAVAKSVLVAIAMLAVLCALPGWSVIHLLAGPASVPTLVQRLPVSSTFSVDAAAPAAPAVASEGALVAPLMLPTAQHEAVSDWAAVSSMTLFGIMHLAGSACVLAWLGLGALAARRLVRDSRPAPIELGRLIAQIAPANDRGFDLLVSDRIDVAVAIGVTRPCVVLPHRWVDDRSAEELQTVLAHEVAHVQNGDLVWLAVVRSLLVLLWAQPLYWLLRRSLRLDQETLADAAAAELSDRYRYAEQLVAWARDMSSRPRLSLPAAMGLWEGPSQLRRRIALLLDERLHVLRDCSRRWRAAAGLMLAAAAIALSLVSLQPASQAADESQPADEADDGQTSLEYSGTVVDKRNDKPVAGATVVVRRQTSATEPWKTLAQTIHTTAADGTYHFTIPPEQLADSHLYIELDVTHPDYAPLEGFGYALSMIRKNEKLGGRPFFERIPVEPAAAIQGIVKTPEGEVVPNVPVLAFSAVDKMPVGDFSSSWSRGKTDAEGKFQINVVKEGKAILWLLPTDYSQQTHVLDGRRGDLGQFTLKDGIRLGGRVLDRSGDPIAGIWVNAELVDGLAKQPINLPVVDYIKRSGLTDADGKFKLGPLPPSTYRILPEERPEENPNRDREPRPLSEVFLPQRVELIAGQELQPMQIEAAETVMIEAQIVDSAGTPRGGHPVHFFGRVANEVGEHYFAEGRPDENGHIVLKVPKGLQDAKLDLSCNEHQVLRHRRVAQGDLQSAREIQLGNLQRDWRDLEIVYYTAPVVIVSARNRDGEPIKEFQPAVFYHDSVKPRQTGSRWLSGVSGEVAFERQEDGRWRSDQLLPDQEFFLTVTADDYQPITQTMSLAEGAIKELSLTLEKSRGDSGD